MFTCFVNLYCLTVVGSNDGIPITGWGSMQYTHKDTISYKVSLGIVTKFCCYHWGILSGLIRGNGS